MGYVKKYISKKNDVENIKLAKIFDNNNEAVIAFGNKENVYVNDMLEILKVFFP